MLRFLHRLLKSETAATAIEYGLIAGLISITIITTIDAVGSQLTSLFQSLGSSLTVPAP